MARAFVSASSQGLQSSTLSISSFNQMSISFWLKWTTFANDDHLAFEYGPNANSNAGTFFIDPDDSVGTNFSMLINLGGGVTAGGFPRPSSGAWHHVIFEVDGTQVGSNAFKAWLDGTSQTITFRASASNAGSFSNQVLNFMCRNQASLFSDGSMADVAIWVAATGSRGGALLSQTEISALANGERPRDIRQTSLAYWWPLDGLQSPEPEIAVGNKANATLTAAPTLASGPPVMMFTPRWPLGAILPVSTPPTFNAAWARGKNTVIEGVAT